jgi:hypothetical protein
MGDYTHMRGIVQIKLELIEILRPRFTIDGEYKVVSWKDVDFPEEIKQSEQYKNILVELYTSDKVPGPFESDNWRAFLDESFKGVPLDKWPKLDYSSAGELRFYCSMKNYDKQQELFLAILPLIASSWEIEQDLNDCREGGPASTKHIRYFKSGE